MVSYRQLKGDRQRAILEGILAQHEENHFVRSLDLLKWENIVAANIDGVESSEAEPQIRAANIDIARLESSMETVTEELAKVAGPNLPKAGAGLPPAGD